MDLWEIQDHVVEVVDQVEPEELLQEGVFEFGKEVDIALLAVPGF